MVLDRRADDARGGLRAQRQALAVEPILEAVHLVLDDIGRVADAAHEQRRRFDDRHAQIAVAVSREGRARGVLEPLPERRFLGQHVVHAANGLDRRRGHGLYATALMPIVFFFAPLEGGPPASPPYVART